MLGAELKAMPASPMTAPMPSYFDLKKSQRFPL
jgi:hypothetical protein